MCVPMLINNVASTTVDGCVEGSFDNDNDNDCDNDDDNGHDNDGNHVNLFFFNLDAVVAMNIVAWVTKQLECPMIKDDIPMISAK